MKNQIVYILPGIFLLINAWYDIRKRKKYYCTVYGYLQFVDSFLMFVDKEKSGRHLVEYFRECFCLPVLMRQGRPLAMEMDWQFVCAVCILEWGQTFAMLFYALLFCSVVSAVMLVCKK